MSGTHGHDEHGHDGSDQDDLPPLDPQQEQEVTRLLAGEPMPSDVWLRLERALMEESAHRETSQAASATPEGAPRRRLRTASIFGLAAAVALVVGGTVVATIDLRGGGQGPAPVAAGTAGGPASMVVASGTDYAPQTLEEQVRQTFLSLQGKLKQGPLATQEPQDRSVDGSMGDRMGEGDMPAMSPDGMPMLMPETMPEGMGDMPFLQDGERFQGCMHKIVQVSADDQVAVLLVDIATMQGVITAIVVIPASEMPQGMVDDPDMEQVFVVTPGCSVKAQAQVDLDAA